MAIPNTVPITGPIAPTAVGDTYPSHTEEYGRGGYRSVADNTERDNIPAGRRSAGMLVYVIGDAIAYRLGIDLTTWTAVQGNINPNNLMLKSVYDPTDSGVVVDSDALDGNTASYYLDRTNHTGTQAQATVTNLTTDLAAKIPLTQKGAANGVVPLNASTKIDNSYLDFSLPLDPVIAWNPVTNTPSISDAGGAAGEIYIVYDSANPTARNLGSGSIDWYDGDAVVYDSGTSAFVRIASYTNGVASVNGLTGVVSIDTSDVPESTDANYVTDDQADALDGANSPSAANPFATLSDLTGIVVGGTYFNAELYSDGQVLGDGTLRTLTSLGYTNGTAAAIWTRVAADVRFTIDVSTMSIDWIAHQEAMLAMEQNGFNGFTAPGGRGYCFNQKCLLPRDQTAISFWRRSFIFKYDFNGSRFANRTGNNITFFEKMPVDQTDANGLRLVYKYFFENAAFYGNDSNSLDDCFIRLGATSSSRFVNIEGVEAGVIIDAQFCLQVQMQNINIGSYGVYGIALRNGTWSGASANNSQCNNASIYDYHSYNGSGKNPTASIYCQGNRLVSVNKVTFEGENGAEHHLLYNWNGATTVKQALRITDMDIESAGASRAAIRVIGNGINFILDGYNNQVNSVDLPVLVEAEANGYPSYSPIQMMIKNSAYDFGTGWKFRHKANVNFDIKWYLEKLRLNNNATVTDASNWDTSLAGTFVPAAGSIYYVPRL